MLGIGVDDAHLVAVEEPQLWLPRGVERQRPCVADAQAITPGAATCGLVEHATVTCEEVRKTAMGHHDPLRCARRPGGEDDVGGVIGQHGRCPPQRRRRIGLCWSENRVVEGVDHASRRRDAGHRGNSLARCTRLDR
ncbi:Uncharacterised protein [Mycobacteroides abscessus subsp. abscessus]|nr:Uncharacterised protein [Mycobacteroides abscessus subsp. abscessus]